MLIRHGKEDLEVQASRQMPHNISYDNLMGAKGPVMAVTMASRSTPPGADLLPTKPQSLNRAIYQPMFFRLAHPVSTVLFLLFIAGAALHGIAWAIAGN